MAMRFYFGNMKEPVDLGPSMTGTWNDTEHAVLGHLCTTKTTAVTTTSVAETNVNMNWDVLLGRWVSDPMARSGRLGGTVQWMLGVAESDEAADQVFHTHIYVSRGDSTEVRGSLLTHLGRVEFPTSAVGRTEGTVDLTPVDCHVSDRLVVEIGYRATTSGSTEHTGTMYYGGTSTTDLVDGSTGVATEPGWIELSKADDVFRPPASTYVLEQYAPFDSGAGADMTEGMWRNLFRNIRDDGVIATQQYPAEATELLVFADSTGMRVKIHPGEVWLQGHWGETLTQRVLPIESSDATHPRVDLVVARANYVDNKIELDVRTGTPAASPVPPTTTHNTALWETPLAEVRVDANVVTIAGSTITDKRVRTGFAAFTRWTPTLYYEGPTFGALADNVANLGTGVNMQTGWPAGAHGRYIKNGTLLQVRYDFRYGAAGTYSTGGGRVYTKLPPGMTHSSYGQSRIPCHLWTQQPNNVDTDWAGTALGAGTNRLFPFFNLSMSSAVSGWYQSDLPPRPSLAGAGGGYPDGGSLVITGILEVQE